MAGASELGPVDDLFDVQNVLASTPWFLSLYPFEAADHLTRFHLPGVDVVRKKKKEKV